MAFNWLKNAITGPFRGIGKFLQGDVKGGLGAWGDTLKVAAPFIPGAGPGLAIGLSAAGGAAQKLDDPGVDFGDVLGGAASGALVGAGGVALPGGTPGGFLENIGKFLRGNPELVQLAGTAANAYGGHQQGQAYDRQLAMQEKDREEQRRLQKLGMLLSAMSSFRPRY